MKRQDRIVAFVVLGNVLDRFLQGKETQFNTLLDVAIAEAQQENEWFTEESIRTALRGVVCMLEENHFADWVNTYAEPKQLQKVACVLAGNIPMVGFHDMLCVLISGHTFIGKLSRKDSVLLSAIVGVLLQLEPRFSARVCFVQSLHDEDYDAVIATGSDNSTRYFEQYFGQKPNIIRKGRSSVAILTGEETSEQLQGLADDIFFYFGLGCRNVSKIYIPKGFDIRSIFPYFDKYKSFSEHSKWWNNYTYNRAIYTVNKEAFHETDFAIFKENVSLLSPISVVYYEEYESVQDLLVFLRSQKEQLQCIVSSINEKDFISLGKAQFPAIDDYADGIDTMVFLQNI